ncbi:VOC family protein [Amycolatopsis sp., V23-08]|uniref:VOC family protein n=1 Tax=Amycolatopsis heterodermiae TaxID=3110235 RepID=A0ABU5R4J8_9PSEU|nr:VOC family protein [Amycolatopsis sp., V23-08]MEA5361142.1 VOC family protein [Amycolatopsis sp., V23-08]
MSVELNHTIVWATDREASAEFLAGILGLPVGPVDGPFRPLPVANGVTLDFATAEGKVHGQHYAFLVGDREFDAALSRLRVAGVAFWADPFHRMPGEINHEAGGRGVYFADPDGHNMELLTRA